MCPECKEPLIAFELEGVEIDRCVNCGGTWLDAGELEMIAERAGAEPGGFTEAISAKEKVRKSRRRCPRCRRRLTVVVVGGEAPAPGAGGETGSSPVELDHCPRGHGLWFDRGEMKAVMESLHDGEEGAVARFFSELYRSELGNDPKGG